MEPENKQRGYLTCIYICLNIFFNANINDSKMFRWSFQELWDVFK